MTKVALVTGGNQGLGFALVSGLANRLGPEDVVYLGARSEDRGLAAVEEIGETSAKVEFARLDVNDAGSITELTDMLKELHGGIDFVASNVDLSRNCAAPLTTYRVAKEKRDGITIHT